MMKPIHAKTLVDALIASGMLPKNCRRVVIDLGTYDVAKLYFECIGDERLLDILTPKNVVGIKTEESGKDGSLEDRPAFGVGYD